MDLTTKMTEESFIPTRATLLNRIKNQQDKESWQAFYSMYRQMLLRIAQKSGLDPQAAEEVLQDTMLTVSQSINRYEYEPKTCSFKGWLLLITRCRIIDYCRKKQRRIPSACFEAACGNMADESGQIDDANSILPDAEWDIEWQQGILDIAIERIRSKVSALQFQIFDFYVIKEWPAIKVAKTLDISLAQVYLAKYRVSAQLKKEIILLREQWG